MDGGNSGVFQCSKACIQIIQEKQTRLNKWQHGDIDDFRPTTETLSIMYYNHIMIMMLGPPKGLNSKWEPNEPGLFFLSVWRPLYLLIYGCNWTILRCQSTSIYTIYIYMVIAVFPVILEMVETCRETTVGVCLNMGNPFTCRGTWW